MNRREEVAEELRYIHKSAGHYMPAFEKWARRVGWSLWALIFFIAALVVWLR